MKDQDQNTYNLYIAKCKINDCNGHVHYSDKSYPSYSGLTSISNVKDLSGYKYLECDGSNLGNKHLNKYFFPDEFSIDKTLEPSVTKKK